MGLKLFKITKETNVFGFFFLKKTGSIVLDKTISENPHGLLQFR